MKPELDGFQLLYYDFNSKYFQDVSRSKVFIVFLVGLYPWATMQFAYPVGVPKFLLELECRDKIKKGSNHYLYCTNEKTNDWVPVEGLAKCKVHLPRKNTLLNVPILGFLYQSRIFYCECAECVRESVTSLCSHDKEKRSWVC